MISRQEKRDKRRNKWYKNEANMQSAPVTFEPPNTFSEPAAQ